MSRNTTIIPKAPLGRILMNAGAKRVSQSAVDAFEEFLMNAAEDIAGRAVKIAQHSGRKTVQDGDVRLAAKQ